MHVLQYKKSKIVFIARLAIYIVVSVSLVAMSAVFNVYSPNTNAQETSSSSDTELCRLSKENDSAQGILDKLKEEADSYQEAIDNLREETSEITAKLDINIREQDRLVVELVKALEEMDYQKTLLGENIRTTYVDEDITTLEMLASSSDLNEYMDKRQYKATVREKIKNSVDEVAFLKRKITTQKQRVDKLVDEQKTQRSKLDKIAESKRRLLSMNHKQQDEFSEKIKLNSSKLQELANQQIEINDSNCGRYFFIRFPGEIREFNPEDYEYKISGHSQIDQGCPGPPVTQDYHDRWGYCTRQCVSYAAWAVSASGRKPPMYWGDAKRWVSKAYEEGVPVYITPEPGDIAVSTSGRWGHVMYVESVSGNTFKTSEYNTRFDGKLHFRDRVF